MNFMTEIFTKHEIEAIEPQIEIDTFAVFCLDRKMSISFCLGEDKKVYVHVNHESTGPDTPNGSQRTYVGNQKSFPAISEILETIDSLVQEGKTKLELYHVKTYEDGTQMDLNQLNYEVFYI